MHVPTLPEHLSSPSVFSWFRVPQSLVFCVVRLIVKLFVCFVLLDILIYSLISFTNMHTKPPSQLIGVLRQLSIVDALDFELISISYYDENCEFNIFSYETLHAIFCVKIYLSNMSVVYVINVHNSYAMLKE